MKGLKLKVCGMTDPENMNQIGSLPVDYMGFIFYKNSPRNFIGDIPNLPENIIKTGVFVDSTLEYIMEKVQQYHFGALQLHGNESVEFCQDLRKELIKSNLEKVQIIKVFSVLEEIDFSEIKKYESAVDLFLFDTKGKSKGGNGTVFNWDILENYPLQTPYFLSGGIGLENSADLILFIQNLEKNDSSNLLYGIDVNSKFEDRPGFKNLDKLKEFKQKLTN